MGPLLSPIIADIVFQDLEEKALSKMYFNIPFYFRYVDDIILSAPIDQISNIIKCFNTQFSQ